MDSIIDNSISKLGDTIKNTTLAKNNSTRLTTDLFSNIGADQPKQRFESYTQYKPDEVYATLSSGEKVAKFENYIPGSNNNERLAQNQTSTEQIFNGLTKAGNNMLTTILGNTAGFVYGIANGVKEGNMNAVFDNSFSKTLDDWNTKLNYQLPNYVTEDNKNKGFFGSLTDDTANFIFNDVAQGLSFTLGTAVSEAIWAYATGGTSLATSAARVGARAASLGRLVRGTEKLGALGRWSKAALGAEQVGIGVSKYKSFLNTAIVNEFKAGKLSKDAAIFLGKAGDVLTTARFIGTTSSNEAGIEAFHFKKEARENFENNFERQYGREATAEERAEFESDLASAANGVYYTNMAILSVSNLAMFGGLFNIKTPFKSLEKQMNKSLFGIGTREVEKGVFKGIEATKGQKIFTGAYQILKPTFTEGVFEEGLQGVTTKVANKWTDSTYNPKYHDQTLSLASAAYESMAEQYGTKEGWKEIGIGGIIGLFGVFGKGGSIAKTKEARKYQEDYVAKGLTAFGEKSLFAQDAFVSSILRDAKIQGSIAREQDAIKRGDAVGAHLAQSDKIIAEAQYREPMGGNLDDLKLHAKIAMNSATEDMWNEAGIKEEDRENFIQATLTGYNQVIDSYKEASNFANALVGNGAIRGTTYQTQVIKDALTHAIVSGEVSHVAMNESLRDITKYIGEENAKAVEIVGSLWQLSKAKQNQVKILTKEHEDITEKEAEVEKKLAELQVKPKSPTEADTTTGTQLQKLAALRVSLQERKVQIEQEQDTIASEIQQLNQRRAIADETSETDLNTSTISGQDLRDIDKKMSNIDSIIEGYSGTNKIDHNNLMTAMKQYKSARDTFYTYQGTVDAISNGKFKIKNKSGFLFKLFDSNYKMDDFTTDFLADISERHLNGYMELGAEEELKNIKAELVTIEAVTDKTEEQQKRIEEINKRIAVLEKEPSLQERKEALERELESIQDDNSSRIAEIDAELNEIERQLTPNDTPNISQEALVKSQIEALERERDERLAELESQSVEVPPQPKKQVKAYRTEGTGMGELGVAYRGTGIYYALDKPFLTGNKGETVSEVSISIPENTLDITTEQGGKTYAEILEQATNDFNNSDKKAPFTNILRDTAVAKGYNAIISFIENEDVSQGREVVSFKGSLETKQDVRTDNTKIDEELDRLQREYDKKIAKLKQQITPTENKTDLQILKDRIAEIVKNLRTGYIGKDIDEMAKNRPDKKDMDRYNELLSIIDGKVITTEQIAQTESEPRTESEIEASVPVNRVADSIGSSKRFVYNGIVGFIKQDGQQIVFESENGLNIYELGNINDLQNTSLNEFDIQEEATLQIDFSDDLKTVTIRGKKYTNSYSNPMSAITKTKDGYTVSLENEKGQKRNFRGQIADQIVYELYLKQFEQNATEQDIEQATDDVKLQAEVEQPTTIRKKYGARKVYAKTERKQSREELLEEFQALKEKLSQWRIYDSLVDDQQSIVDLLDLIQQMEEEVGEKETFEVGQEAFSFLGEDSTPVGFVANLGNNTNFTPTARLINKNVVLTHLKIATIISRIPNAQVTVKQPNKKKLENPSKEVLDKLRDAEIFIKEGLNEYYFKLTPDGRLAVDAEVFKSLSQLLNMYTSVEVTKKYVNWSWHHLSEQVGEELVPMKSDFHNKELTGDSFEIEEGDTMELYVDVNDTHSKDIAKGKNLDELISQVRIYLRKDGKNYNDLKALNTDDVDPNFLALRTAAAKQFLTGKSGVIGTTKITYVPLGLPIMTLESDNTIQPIEITQDGLREVVTTGYILNGELVLANKGLTDKVRKSFVAKLSKKEKDKKVPIIVFKRGKHLIAFPITMNKTTNSKKVEFNAIIEGDGTEAQKIKAINSLLLENGIAPKTYGLTSWDEEKLKTIETVLDNLEDSTPAEALADLKYDKNSLTTDAKVALDLTDLPRVIQSQKLNYDLKNIDYTAKKAEPKAKVTVYDVEVEEQEQDYVDTFVSDAEIKDLVETGEVTPETISNVAKKVSKKKPLSKNEEVVAEVKKEEVAKKASIKKPTEKFTPSEHTTKKFEGVRYFYANDVWNTKEDGVLTPVNSTLNKKLTKNSAEKRVKPTVEKEEEIETVLPNYQEVTVITTDTKAQEAEYNKKTTAIEALAIKLNKLNFNIDKDDLGMLLEDEQTLLIDNLGEVEKARYDLKPKVVAAPKVVAEPKVVKPTADPTEAIAIYENFFKTLSKKAVRNVAEKVRRIIKDGQSEMIDTPIVSPTQEDVNNNIPPVGAIYYEVYKSTSGSEEIAINRFNGKDWLEFNYSYVGKVMSREQADMTKKYFAQIEKNRAEKPLNC